MGSVTRSRHRTATSDQVLRWEPGIHDSAEQGSHDRAASKWADELSASHDPADYVLAVRLRNLAEASGNLPFHCAA